MPRDFPDMASLQRAATIHKFRPPLEGENEHDYRMALATHVEGRDFVESHEIRNGVGWNKFTDEQRMAMVLRSR